MDNAKNHLAESDWLPIASRGFWDVPRVFLVPYQGASLLFCSMFDEEADEYEDAYSVHLIPPIAECDLPADWSTLREKALLSLDPVPVGGVRFDPTLRKAVHRDVLKKIAFPTDSAAWATAGSFALSGETIK